MKQHLGRQSGVQQVEISLLDGKVDITPKEDGQLEPGQLLKATYDSGVSVAEMDITARGKIVKDSSGTFSLQVKPNQAFPIVLNELLQTLEPLAGQTLKRQSAVGYIKSLRAKRKRNRRSH